MRIDICIPAFNEEKIIAEAAQEVVEVLRGIANIESRVIVVDNGSTDETASRAKKVPGVSVLMVPTKGKGAAVIAAARSSSSDIFGFIDADLSADPDDIPKLLAPLVRNEYDIAIGSRLMDTKLVRRELLRTFFSKVFNLLRKAALGISVQDTQCGLKLMNPRGREVLTRCKETGWFFDMEFLAQAERSGLRILEIPVHWDEHRFAGRASKLNLLRDGFKALAAFIRIYGRITTR